MSHSKKGNRYQISFKDNIQELELMDHMLKQSEIMGISTYIEMLIRKDLEEYKNKIDDTQAASELLDKELQQADLYLGKTDVEGAGIIINLSDGTSNIIAEDLINLMNELKTAEAEAISVNGQRVTNLTEFADVDSYIVVNGTRLSSPYTIQVIGNQKYLESGITAKGGFSDDMTSNGKNISITEDNNIKILKYNGDFEIDEGITID